ncbi:anaphase-promoting complex subunit 5 isoform X1 [Rhagoletis pomonella]|uniref:anaphase-promoting complex subunit 5 isoform X1 n=2 Tax=Rhagoletis pomonella TaxID=28610 RepID=UPI00177E38A3|nr:anaphase-promoting complex subunit 5 isoform X1 [Rhagoletis pomonella]
MHYEELDALDPRNATCTTRIETPPPHKVAVLILVQQYLKVKNAATDAGVAYPLQARRNFCMLLLKLIQYPDMTYNDLYNLLTSPRYKINTVHLESFEKAMSNIFTLGIETLCDFAERQNWDNLVSETLGVSQFSIVGLYVRRVCVILERLSFPEIMSLYKNICLYYEKGVRSLAIGPRRVTGTASIAPSNVLQRPLGRTSDEHGHTLEESALDTDTVHQDRNPHSKWSPKQADLFVAQQCKLLENNELRALDPIELQSKLNEIIQDNPLNSQAYFLGYMNQLRLRDYYGAMHALHRAFDRSPMHTTAQYDHKGFQYFSVNLAVLHACFNHRREALNALKECIMLAQECGDKRCLDLANSWYCLLNSNKIDPFEKSLPDIQDPGLVQSLSLAIQYVVKFGAQCGYLPLDLFELLLKSDELNNKNSILEHASNSLALRSALWCLYGRHEISSLYAQLLLQLKKTWAFGDIGNSESVSKVLASLSLWLNVQGENQMSAVVQNHARNRFPRYPNAHNWMISEFHIAIQQCIYRCRWQEALKACSQLYLLDKNAGNLQRASIYIVKRYSNTARRVIQQLLHCRNLDVLTQVRVLVLQAYTTICEDRVSSETVEFLIRASVLAASAYMEYEQAVVDLVLAQVLLKMRMPQKAFQAAKNCMEKIYENGGIYDRAKMDFIFVRCMVAASENDERKAENILKGIGILERAIDSFKKLEAHAKVLDIFIYLAKTFQELKSTEQRNKYASKFKHYYSEYPIAKEYLGMAF